MVNKKIFILIFVGMVFLIFLLQNIFALPAFAGGDGTFDDPYKISTCYDLQNISLINIPQYFELINDIDCSATKNWNSGSGFFPLGNVQNQVPIFQGNFNGNGFSIEGVYMNRDFAAPLGLFSINDGEIKNVYLIEVNISGKNLNDGGFVEGNKIGGLVGENRGNIYNISVKGEIKGEYALGGLVGQNGQDNDFSAKIFESKSDVKITVLSSALTGVGGFTGMNYGEIYNSYALGGKIYAPNANSYITPGVGGFAGGNTNLILRAYSTADLNLLSDSGLLGGFVGFNGGGCFYDFWDTQTSGETTSGCGSGRTTANMKKQTTFTDWDFTNIWQIDEGNNYPCLKWLRTKWACFNPAFADWTSDSAGQIKIITPPKISVSSTPAKIVYLVAGDVPYTPQNLYFEIWEKDSSGDEAIRTGADKLTGTVSGNKLIIAWTITQADIDKDTTEDIDNNFEFYFKVYEGTPSNLIITSSELSVEWISTPCANGDRQPCGTNACGSGTQTCANNAWGSCIEEVIPTTEICSNTLDDDCDGETDETSCSTTPAVCSQYQLCSQIIDPNDCNACQVSSYECEWNIATTLCNPYEDQKDDDGETIHCVYTENTYDTCEDDGMLDYFLELTSGSNEDCDTKTPVSIFCSAQTSLPLENKFGIFLTIISIIGIYFLFFRKKKSQN